jgi:hypothetical protein
MERALSRLPNEPTDGESDVQRLLLQRLNDMRYSQQQTTKVTRPLKKDRLPPAQLTPATPKHHRVCGGGHLR